MKYCLKYCSEVELKKQFPELIYSHLPNPEYYFAANNAYKDFNAGAYNLSNSFNQGNTIANAKFAGDDDISGIKEMEGGKTTVAEYSIMNKNITPFGSNFNDKNATIQKTSYFSKYDDGWRLTRN